MYNDYMTIDLNRDEIELLVSALLRHSYDQEMFMKHVIGEYSRSSWSRMRDMQKLAYKLQAANKALRQDA